jgi:hypothetical protein
MRRWRCGTVGVSFEQPEDADHSFAVPERHRADLHGHPCPGGRDQDAGRLGGRRGAEHLPGEQLASAAAVLGRDNRGEVTTANVTEKPLGGRIEPPDDARVVKDVARDADVLQSLLDVTPDLQAGDHHGSVTDPGEAINAAPVSDRAPASGTGGARREAVIAPAGTDGSPPGLDCPKVDQLQTKRTARETRGSRVESLAQ